MQDACAHALYARVKARKHCISRTALITLCTEFAFQQESQYSVTPFCRWALQLAKLTGLPPPDRNAGNSAADKRRSRQQRNAVVQATDESLDSLPFCLSQEEQQECHADMQAARTTGLLTTQLFSSSIWNMYGKSWACKTHDFVLLSGPLMMYALQNKLSTGPREALCMLFEAISRLWAKSFLRSELSKLKALLHKALLQTSIHFPAAQHDIVQHLMHHIVDGIEEHGPPWASSMWPFERLWHVLISQNHSTRWPATSMMQNYRAGRLANKLCAESEAHLSQAQVCGS